MIGKIIESAVFRKLVVWWETKSHVWPPSPSSSALTTPFPLCPIPTLYSTHPPYQWTCHPPRTGQAGSRPSLHRPRPASAPSPTHSRFSHIAHPLNTAEIRPLSLAGPLRRGTNVTRTIPSVTGSAPLLSYLHRAGRPHAEGSLTDNNPQTSSLPHLLITSWLRPHTLAPAPHPGRGAAQSAAGSCCSTGYQGSSTLGARSAGRPPEAQPEPEVVPQSGGGVGAPSGRGL